MRLACAALALVWESLRSTVTVVGLCDWIVLSDEVLMKFIGFDGWVMLLVVIGGVESVRLTVSFWSIIKGFGLSCKVSLNFELPRFFMLTVVLIGNCVCCACAAVVVIMLPDGTICVI